MKKGENLCRKAFFGDDLFENVLKKG